MFDGMERTKNENESEINPSSIHHPSVIVIMRPMHIIVRLASNQSEDMVIPAIFCWREQTSNNIRQNPPSLNNKIQAREQEEQARPLLRATTAVVTKGMTSALNTMIRFYFIHLVALSALFISHWKCHGYYIIRRRGDTHHYFVNGPSCVEFTKSRLMVESEPKQVKETSIDGYTGTNIEYTPRMSKRRRVLDVARNLCRRLPSLRWNRGLEPMEEKDIISPVDSGKIAVASSQSGKSGDDVVHTSYARQSRAAGHIDFSGTWRPIVTSEFKKEYDEYLRNCGQSFMFRQVVINGIAYQKEVIRQLNNGNQLEIVATNPVGDWNRTLIASDESNPVIFTIVDPSGDQVQLEAWWENHGTKHKSILRGKPNVNGGIFETVRFLECENILVCESSFLPESSTTPKLKYGHVVWKFQRECTVL